MGQPPDEEIRTPEASELKNLAEALADLPLFAGSGGAEALLSQWQAPGHSLLAAFQAGQPVGLCKFQKRSTFGKGAYLSLIALTEAAQGSGLGSRMLAAFEAACSASRGGCFILTAEDNAPAQRFYRRAPCGRWAETLPMQRQNRCAAGKMAMPTWEACQDLSTASRQS